MYDDNIIASNKIITDKDLLSIFDLMNERIREYQNISNQEATQNEKYERNYQHWTLKRFEGTFLSNIEFYDATNVKIDNFNTFISLFNTRLQDIKTIGITYSYSYWIQNGPQETYVSKRIYMNIFENRFTVEFKIPSIDDKMVDIYQLIKDVILRSPEKYDRILKKKSAIENKASFVAGIIPSFVICTLLAFFEPARELYFSTYIVYPIVMAILAMFIGSMLTGSKFDKLYSTIKPNQKYAGYDTTSHKSVYKDDIDDFVSKSEIIIGKNVDNLKNRAEIANLDEMYSKRLFTSILLIIVPAIIMIVVGFIMG